MKKRLINDYLVQYTFGNENDSLNRNIFILFANKECIIFDTGYQEDMSELLLELNGISIKSVVLTHYHPDHCYGMLSLVKPYSIGSTFYLETLKPFNERHNPNLVPNIKVSSTYSFNFYNHIIYTEKFIGHSKSGLLVIIDDKYVLVGDELMYSDEFESSIPYIGYTINDHESSLKRLLDFDDHIFLPSHGNSDKVNIIDDINNRLKYLDFLKCTNNKNIEDFYKINNIRFINDKWHSNNISNLRKIKSE